MLLLALNLIVYSIQLAGKTISDGPSCEESGGSWDGDCTISNLTINSGETLNINTMTRLVDTGSITNHGTVNSDGYLIVSGTFTNHGTININGEILNCGTIDNFGDITNQRNLNNSNGCRNGTINNHGTIVNEDFLDNRGTINNFGTFDTRDTFQNVGRLINDGSFIISGSVSNHFGVNITNNNTMINNGTMNNTDSGQITNAGTLTNNNTIIRGDMVNSGILINIGGISNIEEFTNAGEITNSGSIDLAIGSGIIENSGSITNQSWISASIFNHGTVINRKNGNLTSHDFSNASSAIITNTGTCNFTVGPETGFSNSGTVNNKGTCNLSVDSTTEINHNGIVDNSGTLVFEGDALSISGTLANSGTIVNSSPLTNQGSLINTGVIYNLQTINNASNIENPGTIYNSQTINNTSSIENSGAIYNRCDADYTGTPSNENPVIDLCGIIPWFDEQWQNRKKITIHQGQVSSILTQFPVLIVLVDGELSKAREDGFDIVITADNGTTEIPYQREKWNRTTGELVMWINVPILKDFEETTLYLYYNNPSQTTDKANSQHVWTNGFANVWHLDNTLKDSCNVHHGTNNGSVAIKGKIGDARYFDGVDDNVTFGNLGLHLSTAMSKSIWLKTTDISAVLIDVEHGGDNAGFYIEPKSAGTRVNFQNAGDKIQRISPASLVVDDVWHHMVWTYDGLKLATYLDGQLVGVPVSVANDKIEHDFESKIGMRLITESSRKFEGILDEARVYSEAKSRHWITTEFNNQNDPDSFYTVGEEENDPFLSVDDLKIQIQTIKEQINNLTLTAGALQDQLTNIELTPGPPGPQGDNGTNCSVEDTSGGARIVCEDGTAQEIFDGQNGTDAIDTLSELGCSPGQVAKWNGVEWACANDNQGSRGLDNDCTNLVPGADLRGCTLIDADLVAIDLTGADLTNADLTGANLGASILIDSNLTGVNLSGAILTNVNLTNANMRFATIRTAVLTGADLTGANLVGVIDDCSDLVPGGSMIGCELRGHSLSDLDLSDSFFNNADLRNTDLSGADLSGADLSGAMLDGAILDCVNHPICN